MTIKNTGNIYNDLGAYKHQDIIKAIQIMELNSTKNNLYIYENSKISLSYEFSVVLVGEDEPRQYGFKTLNELLTASYFVSLLVGKEGNTVIADYNLYTTVKDENGIIVLEDTTDNFHFWRSLKEKELLENERKLKKELEELRLYKQFITEHNAEKEFLKWKEKKEKVLYWYKYLYRGCSLGAQPSDFLEVDHSKCKFGIVAYDRELTVEECKEYELRRWEG